MDVDPNMGEVADFDQETTCHPALRNNVILRTVFGYLETIDLKNTCLVSTLWRDVSRQEMYRNSMVVFRTKQEFADKGVGEFCSIFGNNSSSRYRKFTIRGESINQTDYEMTGSILRGCGAKMELLQLNKVTFVGAAFIREVFLTLIPNLKHLVIMKCTFYTESSDNLQSINNHLAIDQTVKIQPNLRVFKLTLESGFHKLPFDWFSFFTVYPNIEEMLIHDIDLRDAVVVLSKLQDFKSQNPQTSRVRKLDIFHGESPGYQMENTVLEELNNIKFNLDELVIDFGTNYNINLCRSVIEQNKSVKILKIQRTCNGSNIGNDLTDNNINFPCLEFFQIAETMTENFNFTSSMSKLKTLIMCEPFIQPQNPTNDIRLENGNNLQMSQALTRINNLLTTLKIQYPVSCGLVSHLMDKFPRVKTLQMYITNDIFRLICGGNWSDLEDLDVLGYDLTDEGITGRGKKTAHGFIYETYHDSNITRLRYLRKFMVYNDNLRTLQIGDDAVINGFLKLKYLNHFTIGYCRITDSGWCKLYDAENILTLIPNHNVYTLLTFQKPYRQTIEQIRHM